MTERGNHQIGAWEPANQPNQTKKFIIKYLISDNIESNFQKIKGVNMVYRNKAGQPRERAMVAAYSLVTEFGATQQNVAKVLNCSQATIANWVKEVGFKKQIDGLERELGDAKEYISVLRHEILGDSRGYYLEHGDS